MDQSAQLWIWPGPASEAVCSGVVEQAATVTASSEAMATRCSILVIDILVSLQEIHLGENWDGDHEIANSGFLSFQ